MSNKNTVFSQTVGKGEGANEGGFMSGAKFTGSTMRYEHGIPIEQEAPQYSGPKLSEVLAAGGGKRSISISVDDYGNHTTKMTDNSPVKYNGKAGEIAEGMTAVTGVGANAIHNLSDLKDDSLVKVGKLEMRAVDAANVGLLNRNADGSYGEAQGLETKTASDRVGEAHQDFAPIVAAEASEGVSKMSHFAGESVDGDVVDIFLAVASGQDELSNQLIEGMVQKVGSKMSKSDIISANQAVINSLVKEVRAIRPDGLEVAMEKLDKMMNQGRHHEARSTVLGIYAGDRKALARLLGK